MKRKNLIYVMVAILATLMATSCGKQSNPIKVAEKFANAFYNCDFDACNKLLEKEEFVAKKDMDDMSKAMIKEMQKESKKNGYVAKVNKEECEIDEEDAWIVFIITDKEGYEKQGYVELEKDDDGKWLVTRYKL